jgi:Asp-tRNA(Asn)/Glu-tRNA(Gln) amidotransferase C subunit
MFFFEDGEKNMRGFSQKEALQNAKNTKNGQFVVKRIMEG